MAFLVEASSGVLFSIFYFLFSVGFVLQFREFRGAGISVENIFGAAINCSEDVQLIEFHLRRTAFATLAHASIPVGKPRSFYPSIHPLPLPSHHHPLPSP